MGVELPIIAAGLVPAGASPGDKAPNVRECTVTNIGTGNWQVSCFDRTISSTNAMLKPSNNSSTARITFTQTSPGPDFVITAIDSAGAAVDVEFSFDVIRMPSIR